MIFKKIQIRKDVALIVGGILVAIVLLSLESFSPLWWDWRDGAREISDFGKHQKITSESKLYMHFPDKMSEVSVFKNLEKPEGIEGEMYWDNNVLIFEPEEKMEEGKTYTFRAKPETRLASGRPLNKKMEFKFTVGGPPELSTHFPTKDATDIPTDSNISLVFDRPIIPLSAIHTKTTKKYNKELPIAISPKIEGKWRWLGTSTIKFEPKNELEPATVYKVRVPKGITTVIGDKTIDDFSWEFTTMRPKVITSTPYQSSSASDSDKIVYNSRQIYSMAGPDTEIALTFNQEINLESAQKSIQLFKYKTPAKRDETKEVEGAYKKTRKTTEEIIKERESLQPDSIPIKITYFTEETEDKKELKNKKIKIVPKNPLEFNSRYNLKVKTGIKGIKGHLGSEKDFNLHFSTVGDFKVNQGSFEGKRYIKIKFSNPVNDEILKENITITPEVEGWEDIELKTHSWSSNRDLTFYPNFKPSTKYTVTLNENIADKFGQKLKESYSFEFTTPELDPDLYILSKGQFGIFEDNRPSIYPFQAVNLSQLNIEFARIPFVKFLKIRQNKQSNWQYKPDLSKYIGYKQFTFKLKNEKNKSEIFSFDIEKELGKKLAPGIYALSIKAPEYKKTWGDRSQIINYQYFTLTNAALTLKYSGSKALVWAVNMQTGEPIADMNLKFYTLKGETPVTGKTDQNGFAEATLNLKDFQTSNNEWNPEFWVTATKGADFAFIGSNWNHGFDPWNFKLKEDFRSPRRPDDRLDAYLYTERKIYRPGDTVHFKGITRLRDKDGIFRIANSKHKIAVTITDAKYNEIYKKTLDLNEFGSFADSIPIDSEAPLGNYSINAKITPDDKVDRNYIRHSFAVLAYRKPEYSVEIEPEQDDYFDDNELQFNIKGNYYFGAPMSEAKVDWHANSTDYFFNRYTDGWYSFALEDVWCWWGCEKKTTNITEGKGELDKNGNLEVSFPVDLDDKSLSQIVTLEADITDPNNQVVSNRASVPVHKANVYVGVRNENYSVKPGEKARINVITLKPDGTPFKKQKVTVKLFSREWNTVKKKSVDGEYYYDNEPKDTFIRETNIITDLNGKANARLLIDEGGSYRAIAETKDKKGRVIKAGTSLYAFSNTYINWPHSNHDRIDIIADKPEYKVGDTAKLLIKSPFQGKNVKALITVERENIITRKVIVIESNAQPIEIPITADLIPNAYVSAVIIKPRDGETFDENGEDTGAPAFKIGYVKLKVETSQKKLNVNIETDKPKYGPGETVNVKIKTQNWQNKPVPAELSLGVVDMSVIALLGFQMPDLVRNFYEERGLGVKTAQMLTYLIEAFKPGSKGGGGGDPESRMRMNFKDTAYWNPSIITNENGEAELSFTLPDNLTTWQLLAIANTKDHLFGAQAHTVIETKKVILRPARPRFAVVGDEIKLGAIVHNFMDKTQKFTVTLTGTGFESAGKIEKNIRVKPDEHKKIIFPIIIDQTKKVTFHFKAQSGEAVDEIKESIPVYAFGTPQSVATSGITEKETMESVYIPPSNEASHGTLTTIISPTLATYMPKGLDYLVRFPYGCAEQTVSSFLPNVAVASLQGFEVFKVVDDETLEKNIIGGLERLYTFQRGDGGFGYWSGGGGESHPYLTAYIIFALEMTKEAGHTVDENVLNRAKNYLQSVLRNQDINDKINLTNRAYILYVLSEGGKNEESLANNLYEKRTELPLFAQAQLAMVYQKTAPKKAQTLLEEILNHIKIDSRGAHFEEKNERYWRWSMNTNTRTTATVLQALIRIDPDHDLIPKIVRYILAVREQGHWDTTQSTVTSIFALVEFLKQTKELEADFETTVHVNDQEILSSKFNQENILTKTEVITAFEELKEEQMNSILISKKDGPGRLYYDLVMDYFFITDEIPPAEEGIGITREMTSLDEKEKGVHVQGTYKIKLTITIPESRHFVAVESPLPAGFEAIDFSLKTSQQRLADEVNKTDRRNYRNYWSSSQWRFNHKEFRDDRVFLFADYLPSGVYEYEYLVRATTPGKFKYRPARAWEMYYPETFGQTDGGWFEIRE